MITRTERPRLPAFGPRRAGMGGLIVVVLCVLILLAMLGMSTLFQSSGTARTYGRITGIRSILEAGDSAIAEAVVCIRRSVDSGWTSPECPDDWRALLRAVLSGGAWPRGRTVSPKACRQIYTSDAGALQIDDVTVDLIDFFMPTPPAGSPQPPQGVLDLAVDVAGPQRAFRVRKRVRQRMAFYVTFDGPTAKPPAPPPGPEVFTILSNPLATVIE